MKQKIYQIIYLVCWLWHRLWLPPITRQGRTPKLLIVPCEPWSVNGSRGDDAMITAMVQDFRQRHPQGELLLVTASNTNDELVKHGILSDARLRKAWRGRVPFLNIVKWMRQEAPTECFLLGADCMDGHYSVLLSMTLLFTADMAARLGIATRLTGFSFNDQPARILPLCFRLTTTKLALCLRDPVSLQRFEAITHRKGELVADVAFLLQPCDSEKIAPYLEWVNAQRESGKTLLGFNIHGLLFGKDIGAKEHCIPEIGAQLHGFLTDHPNVSCLLLPHDFRGQGGGDVAILRSVAECLHNLDERILLVAQELSSGEIKALCGALDAVFASRMHLGIAALGMGKPIAGFGYQGKFAGLFQHFDYPLKWLLDVRERGGLAGVLGEFVQQLPSLTEQVASKVSAVQQLAARNRLREGENLSQRRK